jgi:hypothetical protein
VSHSVTGVCKKSLFQEGRVRYHTDVKSFSEINLPM